jgi:hypothetical protein
MCLAARGSIMKEKTKTGKTGEENEDGSEKGSVLNHDEWA